MKVLWLCNVMLPMVAEYLGLEATNKEGWLSGLMNVVLQRREENDIKLAVAFPGTDRQKMEIPVNCAGASAMLCCYSFRGRYPQQPELYDETLEGQLREIVEDFQPDVVHCFGTEYPHTLAMCRVFPQKEKILIGIQGLCSAIAREYYANLPVKVIDGVTFRDFIRKDSIWQQQRKFVLRGEMELEALRLAGNVTGRTDWDKAQVEMCNPGVKYYHMNETLRSNFYDGSWNRETCEPCSIFVSQGDYPLKGLHYMLLALPRIREVYPTVKLYVAGPNLTADVTWKQKLKLSGYGKYMRTLINSYGLEEHVCFTGRLNAEEMKARYLKSHLFVCCSSLENSPNSLGEAMLLGVPCVSALVGGVPTIFKDGQDGISYVTSGKGMEEVVEALAGAVLKMWSDEKAMETYSNNARLHAKRTHDSEANYQRLVEIYADIAGRPLEDE